MNYIRILFCSFQMRFEHWAFIIQNRISQKASNTKYRRTSVSPLNFWMKFIFVFSVSCFMQCLYWSMFCGRRYYCSCYLTRVKFYQIEGCQKNYKHKSIFEVNQRLSFQRKITLTHTHTHTHSDVYCNKVNKGNNVLRMYTK